MNQKRNFWKESSYYYTYLSWVTALFRKISSSFNDILCLSFISFTFWWALWSKLTNLFLSFRIVSYSLANSLSLWKHSGFVTREIEFIFCPPNKINRHIILLPPMNFPFFLLVYPDFKILCFDLLNNVGIFLLKYENDVWNFKKLSTTNMWILPAAPYLIPVH